jgi:hypothetical protein
MKLDNHLPNKNEDLPTHIALLGMIKFCIKKFFFLMKSLDFENPSRLDISNLLLKKRT